MFWPLGSKPGNSTFGQWSSDPGDEGAGPWESVDLTEQRVRLADDVVVWPTRQRGRQVYNLEIPLEHKFFQLGKREYVLISLLDGKTTLAQACGIAASQLGRRALSASESETILRWLLAQKLAHIENTPPPIRNQSARPATRDGGASGWLWQNFNPFWCKFPVLRKLGVLQTVFQSMGWLFHPATIGCGAVFLASAGARLLIAENPLGEDSLAVIAPSNWAWLLAIWLLLKLVHESAHAIACYRIGGTVKELGVVFVLLAPLAYVDVSSCWRVPSRASRMLVSGAGMWIELLIASLGVLMFPFTSETHTQWLIQSTVVVAGVSTLVFNLNALMRFDGYYLLTDWLQVPNLYQISQQFWKRWYLQSFFGIRRPAARVTSWRRWFCIVYGLATTVWKVVVCVTLMVTASAMLEGAGVVLAVMASITWWARPLAVGVRTLSDEMRYRRFHFWKGICLTSGLALLLVAAVFWIPCPTSINVPGVVRLKNDATLRSGADALVTRVHVRHGQRVRPGDVLLEMENPELKTQIDQLRLQLTHTDLLLRTARDEHDAAEQKVLNTHRASLEEQIRQLEPRLRSLSVVSDRHATVDARRLGERLGTYVREGETLVRLSVASEKEVACMIPQDDIRWVRKHVGQMVRVKDRSDIQVHGVLDLIAPRASMRLPLESLAATEQGPLMIESEAADSEEESERVRLARPHFLAHVRLDEESAKRLPIGMRSMVRVGYRTDSLGHRLERMISDLWRERFKR